MAPWPNRVADGRYSWGGTQQLPLTEPERGNALHGLVSWVRWAPVSHDPDQVVLEHALVPQTGYPFQLLLRATYRLDEGGLTTTLAATNVGSAAAPYGCGPHPYLVAGGGRVDDWSLSLPASRYLEVSEDRLLPVAEKAVDGSLYDFRNGAPIGDAFIDHAFTSLAVGTDGLTRVRLTGADGGGVECSWDPDTLPWVQVHTADRRNRDESRLGLAVEPMTCPPDAFNLQRNVIVIEPGATHTASWTITAIRQ